MTREQIQALPTRALWAIVRSTHAMSERFANQLTWAKAELMRRGFTVAGEAR
jgi:hypothetical protein